MGHAVLKAKQSDFVLFSLNLKVQLHAYYLLAVNTDVGQLGCWKLTPSYLVCDDPSVPDEHVGLWCCHVCVTSKSLNIQNPLGK